MAAANGAILYHGPSLLDGSPIVAIVTGLATSSENAKTGAMLQTWILRADVAPLDALREGADVAICGDCPHRSKAAGGSGACYVNVGQAPRSVWAAWKRGVYTAELPAADGRMVRLGSYGDPAAVPAEVWERLIQGASGWTGYTHQWRTADALKALCMASVDSPAEALEAQLAGWRTFRVAAFGNDERLRLEARCPASEEAGRKVQCAACPIKCNGSNGNVNVVIQAHGTSRKRVVGA